MERKVIGLGLDQLPRTFDFKDAGNLPQKGDWSDFTLNRDAAPNDRFNDLARLIGEGDVRHWKAATVHGGIRSEKSFLRVSR